MSPGRVNAQRSWFCAKLLGLVFVSGFVLAATVGIAFPDFWRTVLVPVLVVVPFILMLLIAGFGLRALWCVTKTKHYETLHKLRTDPRFK